MPFDQLEDFITPSELFYIRSHFPTQSWIPSPIGYRLNGAVRNELSLSYADIRAMPSRTCVATLECAGNSRYSWCRRAGAQWELGAVGNAEWTVFPVRASGARRANGRGLASWCSKAPIAACRRKSQSPGSDLLCPQYPENEGDGVQCIDRLPDERTGSDTRSWLSAARHRAGHYAWRRSSG